MDSDRDDQDHVLVPIYFSDVFEVDEQVVDEYGAFNVALVNDLPLFVDPFLLFDSEGDKYRKLHDGIIEYLLFLVGLVGNPDIILIDANSENKPSASRAKTQDD